MLVRTFRFLAGFGACFFAAVTVAEAVDCPRGGTLLAGASDYRPYQKVEGKDVSGMDVEVLEAVLGKLGCSLKIDALPWARHLKGIQDGSVDIASPVSKTEERESYAHFTSPYVNARQLLFVAPGNETASVDLTAFFAGGGKLGAIREYAYGGDYMTLKETHAGQVDETDSLESNLKKLAAGRVDATLGEEFVVGAEIKRLGLGDKVVASETVISSDPSYFMFSKASVPEEFVAAFSAELQKMKDNGEFDAIIAKYR
ncbi:substrate-binding periplasmic protein [Roseibium sp.]|uniref:substrate-binding periplasmic protein n=1 Tax=Roseibium sp. TaxID=1936156 RepID=UPI003BAF05BE